MTGSDAAAALPRILEHSDSLQANTAQILYTYLTNEAIREQGYKVALNGAGGDELFVGYSTFRADGLFRRHPATSRTRSGAGSPGRHRSSPRPSVWVSLDYQLKKFTGTRTRDPLLAHASWRTIFDRDAFASLFVDEDWEPPDAYLGAYRAAYSRVAPGTSFLKTRLLADFTSWLIPMLTWVDNMSMAHSVELRLPFLDHRLVHQAARVARPVPLPGLEAQAFHEALPRRSPASRRAPPAQARDPHAPLGVGSTTSSPRLATLSSTHVHSIVTGSST